MGLSASQGRMLSLTSRMSNLEYKAQSISNQKMRLADQSESISKNYLDALSAKKLTAYDAESNTYIEATLDSIYKLNQNDSNGKKRMIVDINGNIVCPGKYQTDMAKYATEYSKQTGNGYASGTPVSSEQIADKKAEAKNIGAGNLSAFGSEADYLNFMFDGNVPTEEETSGYESVQYLKNVYSGLEAFAQKFGYTTADNNVRKGNYFQGDVSMSDGDGKNAVMAYDSNMVNKLTAEFNNAPGSPAKLLPTDFPVAVTSKNSDSTEYLYDQLSMGNWFIVEYNNEGGSDGEGAWEKISWSSGDSKLVTQDDERALAQAEAEYELAMSQVQSKDKRFDMELKQIDTEHSAVEKQMDSVSKAMQNNIERTFKLFNG